MLKIMPVSYLICFLMWSLPRIMLAGTYRDPKARQNWSSVRSLNVFSRNRLYDMSTKLTKLRMNPR